MSLTQTNSTAKNSKISFEGTLILKPLAFQGMTQKIWAWWKTRKDKFPYHGLAVRLLVLAQLSSCSVERVFSVLERIRRLTGDGLLEDMREFCLLLQINGDLDDMYDDLVVNYGRDA